MTSDNFRLLPLAAADKPQIVRLFRAAPHQHIHLDWHTLDACLNDPDLRCWVAWERGQVRALLGATLDCPPHEAGVSWVRLAIPVRARGHDPVLDALWGQLRDTLAAEGIQTIALLAVEPWIEPFAQRWGFVESNAVITLRREGGALPSIDGLPLPQPVTPADLDAVAAVDAAAFEPLWRYNRPTLALASREAAVFTLHRQGGEVAAYQLSTSYPGSGHVARVGVRPGLQGLGLGKALIIHALRFFKLHGIQVVTVNTQQDNERSQRLYEGLGFAPTGHAVPVWTLTMN